MNRFSTYTKYGIQYVRDHNIVYMPIADFEAVERKLQKLAAYEGTGETPESINNLHSIARAQSDAIIRLGEQLEDQKELQAEINNWKNEAVKANAAQGKIKVARTLDV